MMRNLLFFSMGIWLFLANNAQAQDFVYTPKNPAFGGNPYNYSWLLSSAQSQDTYKAATDETNIYDRYYGSDPVADFSESLNRQILSQLSRQIVSNQFGEEALTPGTYNLGNYQIEVGESGAGVDITITDNTTGATTTVQVPYF